MAVEEEVVVPPFEKEDNDEDEEEEESVAYGSDIDLKYYVEFLDNG